ncbi:MAG: hypothetical protein LLG04_12155 [Parachlamydia sp.]|nr:hypothetical protein [Parachlamydia sp.]
MHIDKPDSLHTMGLDFTNQRIRAVQLTLRKGKPVVDRLFDLPIASHNADPAQPPHYILEHDEPAFRDAVSRNLTVSTMAGGEVLVRQLEVKLKKVADIDAVLSFQAEPVLPYPVDNAFMDRVILSETTEGRNLALLAVRRDHLQQHLELWRAFEVEPEVVAASPAALAAFVSHLSPFDPLQCVIHLGDAQTSCILMRENKLLAAQACFQGLNQLRAACVQDNPGKEEQYFNQLNFADIQKESTPHLAEALDNLRMEITRTLYALSKQAKGQEFDRLVATGDGVVLNQLASVLLKPLLQATNRTFTVLEAPEGLGINSNQLQEYAIPFGAALMALPGGEMVNFRQGEFAYPLPWKRYQTPVIFYLALCAGLAAAIFFAGNSYIRYQEDGLRKEYSELLQSLNRPYTEFEKSFSKKSPDGEKVISIRQLTQADIANRLQALQKEIESSPETYPLLPNVPTVSDLLAWLSTHPNVVSRDPKSGKVTPLLQLENLTYTMLKRPEQTKKQEKYQVKVELEFSSETPKAAREFHDALIAPNAMVDPKGEVKWSTNRGLYRASFFLKDKTVYPTPSS